MANRFSSFVSKLVRKLAMAATVSVLALLAWSLWLYGKDRASYEERRAELSLAIRSEETSVTGQLAELRDKQQRVTETLTSQRQRVEQAERVLKSLHESDPGLLSRVFGDSAKIASHEAQLARVETIKNESLKQIVDLQRELSAHELAITPLELRLQALKIEADELKREEHPAFYYLRTAWAQARWFIAGVFVAYLFGGVLVAMVLYYGWARWVTRGKAILVGAESNALPVIGESAVVAEDSVWPGETVWVRKRFLQSADEELTRGRRLVFNWSSPISSLAAGLSRLVELRNARSQGERSVVFACVDDPFAELVIVSVPEGGSFVLRPRFLAACIADEKNMARIRRRWRFLNWQSWVSGQCGYFEFSGPCRLVVSCISALHAEPVTAREEGTPAVRRTTQAGLVGFTPRLELKPVRSAGFWRYCRGGASLFDVQLSGTGVFLSRQNDARSRDGARARFFRWFGI